MTARSQWLRPIVLGLGLASLCNTPALAQPGWFNNNAGVQAGIKPNLPDFYQHQGFVGDPADTWESSRPDAANYPQLAVAGGWCRPTAITDSLANWALNGYSGIVRAGTVTNGAWQPAYQQTVRDLDAAINGAGIQKYLDDKFAAVQGTANQWPTKLVFNQYTIDQTTGAVESMSGQTLKTPDGSTLISAFNTYGRTLLNGQDSMLRLTTPAGTTFSPTLWWQGNNPNAGNFHYVTGAGVDLKSSQIFFADPDSNKGNQSADPTYKPGSALDPKSGSGGWVFEKTDPSKVIPFTLVDAKTGAVFTPGPGSKFTLAYYNPSDPTANAKGIVTKDYNGGGVAVTMQKANDANIDARKFTAADVNLPKPANPDPTNAATYKSYYGTFKVDNTSAATGFKVTASDDKDGNITANGRYAKVQFDKIETIGPQGADPLAPVRNVNGLKTEVKMVSAIANPVNEIQLAAINNAAIDDPSINHHTFTSTGGGTWLATYLQPGTLDGFGDSLTQGGWDFKLTSGNALAPIDFSASIQDTLDAFVETGSALTQFDYLEHVQATSTADGSFGDYWSIQSIGSPEQLYPDQVNPAIPSLSLAPEPSTWILLAGGCAIVLFVGRRPRPTRQALAGAAAVVALAGIPSARAGSIVLTLEMAQAEQRTGQAEPSAASPAPAPAPEPGPIDRAVTAFGRGDYDACLKQLGEAARADAALPPARLLFAKLALQKDQPGLVRAALERAVGETPDHPEVYLLFGVLAVREERWTDATLHLARARELMKADRWAGEPRRGFERRRLEGEARIAEARGDWKAVRAALEDKLKLDRDDATTRQRLGKALFHLAEYDAAYQELQRAARSDTSHALEPPAITMGWLYQQAGDRAKAGEWMDYAVRTAPDSVAAHLGLAAWLLDQGRTAQAQPHAAEAIRRDPSSIAARRLLGLVERANHHLERAWEIYQALARETPEDPWVCNQLALVLAEQADDARRREALELAEQNVRRAPGAPEALVTLGLVYHRLRRLDEADSVLQAVVASGQASSDALYTLARVRADRGRAGDAPGLLKAALAAPGFFAARDQAREWLEKLTAPGKSSAPPDFIGSPLRPSHTLLPAPPRRRGAS